MGQHCYPGGGDPTLLGGGGLVAWGLEHTCLRLCVCVIV